MQINNKQGLGLVEILITLGLLGGITLGVMQLTKSMFKNKSKFDFDSDASFMTNEMISILSDSENCKNTFQGLSANNGTVNRLKYKTSDKFIINSVSGNSQIKILSYRLDGTDADADLVNKVTVLKTEFEAKKIQGASAVNVIKRIKIKFTEDAANNIISCYAIAAGKSDFWIKGSGANLNDIYYPSGKVGIGTATPNANFELKTNDVASAYITTSGTTGNSQAAIGLITSDTNTLLDVGSSSLGWAIYGRGNNWSGFDSTQANSFGVSYYNGASWNNALSVLPNGNVGLGNLNPQAKLHVSGGTIRGRLQCRIVNGPGQLTGSVASCGADEYVIGGGGTCESAATGTYLHESRPQPDMSGWFADCFGTDGTDRNAFAHAICCQL